MIISISAAFYFLYIVIFAYCLCLYCLSDIIYLLIYAFAFSLCAKPAYIGNYILCRLKRALATLKMPNFGKLILFNAYILLNMDCLLYICSRNEIVRFMTQIYKIMKFNVYLSLSKKDMVLLLWVLESCISFLESFSNFGVNCDIQDLTVLRDYLKSELD